MSLRKEYDEDLARLRRDVEEMGQKAEAALRRAIDGLQGMDAPTAAEIMEGDRTIDSLERNIEHRCMTLLLRQQPVASDLRRVTAALKMVTDMERLGDHAADLAELEQYLGQPLPEGGAEIAAAVRAMADDAFAMVEKAIAAFAAEDEEAARAVIRLDDGVDEHFNAIKKQLGAFIARSPEAVDAALDYLMVIKYLERIGDHAVNIAEWAIYNRTGLYKNQRIV